MESLDGDRPEIIGVWPSNVDGQFVRTEMFEILESQIIEIS